MGEESDEGVSQWEVIEIVSLDYGHTLIKGVDLLERSNGREVPLKTELSQ